MFETEFEALLGIFDAILQFPETLVSAGVSLIGVCVYPFVLLMEMFGGWWGFVWSNFVTLTASLTSLHLAMRDAIELTLGVFVPTAWMTLLIVMLGINVALRLYTFLRSISIFGLSI